jgi:nickel/cobalt transporter (NicO) family protein
VQLELDLTPGMALAPALLTDIDRNRDGSVSGDEQQTYSRLVIDALELAVDGTRVPLQLATATFPPTDAIGRGEGTVQLRATAMLPPLGDGVHHLTFRNRHHPDRSVYLANALVPESDAVAITAQRRHGDQSALTIDYELRHTPGTSRAAWLLSGIALASLLLAIAVRVVRRRARTDSR